MSVALLPPGGVARFARWEFRVYTVFSHLKAGLQTPPPQPILAAYDAKAACSMALA